MATRHKKTRGLNHRWGKKATSASGGKKGLRKVFYERKGKKVPEPS